MSADPTAALSWRTLGVGRLARHIRAMCGEDDQAFIDTLEGETDALEAVSAVLRYRAEQEAQAEAMAALGRSYADRGKVLAERAERAKAGLFQFLQEIGEKTLRLPEATLSISAGKPKLVGETDPAMLPEALVKTERKPDAAAIRAALDAGDAVPGYSLSNAQPHLTVRVR